MKDKILNLPTIKRLPTYLHILRRMKKSGQEYVSTTQLIKELDFEPVLVRKDLALVDLPGKPRLGYKLNDLVDAIESFLCWDESKKAYLVGAGSLGCALMRYEPFESCGLDIVAGFDNDPAKIGSKVGDKEIFGIDSIAECIRKNNIDVAVLTVPWQHAQVTADFLINAGIKAIWNFTTVKLKVPEHVITHNESLAAGLAVFTVKMKRQSNEIPGNE